MGIDQIFNFIRIDDRIVTSGQPTEEQFSEACNDGYKAVINLAPYGKADSRLPKIEDEACTLANLNVAYRYIPVEWTNPHVDDYAKFCDSMEEFEKCKVIIHCAANMRVSVFFSSYAIKRYGWSENQADELISRAWGIYPQSQVDGVWQ